MNMPTKHPLIVQAEELRNAIRSFDLSDVFEGRFPREQFGPLASHYNSLRTYAMDKIAELQQQLADAEQLEARISELTRLESRVAECER